MRHGVIYLDNNATTRPTPGVMGAMTHALHEGWHNPSSTHRGGQAARHAVERARADVAELLGCTARNVVFTSGGTESIALAFHTALRETGRRAVVISSVEHEAIRGLCDWLTVRPMNEGGPVEVRVVPVSREGVIDAGAAEAVIDASVALVSVQWANNETGGVQPIEGVARRCRERGVLFHTDATQWVGKMRVSLEGRGGAGPGALPIDMLTCSAHKFHGPKGVGTLYVREGLRAAPLLFGTQERGARGGTENVPGIVGMGAAAREAVNWLIPERDDERAALESLRDEFVRELLAKVPGARVNGPTAPAARLWNTSNLMFPGVESETLLMLLSERGVFASAGAACASGSLEPSPVLHAMGLTPEEARSSVRFSLSRETAQREIEEASRIMRVAIESLRDPPTATSTG